MRPRRLKKQSNNGEDQYCEFDKLISGCLLAGIHTKNVGWRAIHDRVKDMGLTRTQQHLQPGAFFRFLKTGFTLSLVMGPLSAKMLSTFSNFPKQFQPTLSQFSDTGQCEAKRVGQLESRPL